jgi:aldose 1-epimerase
MHDSPSLTGHEHTMINAASGEQFEITCENQHATVVEVGAGVREYRVGDLAVLDPYPVDAICDGAHGQPLLPWPNRLQDGRYSYDDTEFQLPLTEPAKHNAIHGLTRWASWSVQQWRDDMVVLGYRLHPTPGYPFALDLAVGYRIDLDGLTVTITATNVGRSDCPYGCGQHPYLSAGGHLLDECTLQFDAATRIDTDPDRKLPTGTTSPVPGGPYDFRTARPIGELAIDDPFTNLTRDAADRSRVLLGRPDGCVVEAWAGPSLDYLELYTGDQLASGRRRRGLGVEPMSCPPNAFRSGEGLVRLAPGDTCEFSWGAGLVAAS